MSDAPSTIPSLVDLDRLVHEPARLTLLAHLYVLEAADFVFLMRETGLTQGNLSSHLSKLESAGYTQVTKGFSGKRPQTMIAMTAAGRSAFRSYVERMRSALGSLG